MPLRQSPWMLREQPLVSIYINMLPKKLKAKFVLELVVDMCPKLEKMMFIYHKDICPSLLPISGNCIVIVFVYYNWRCTSIYLVLFILDLKHWFLTWWEKTDHESDVITKHFVTSFRLGYKLGYIKTG